MAPTLSFSNLQTAVQNNNTLTSTSFTPATGDIIVVKAVSGDPIQTMGTPTGGGWTYTNRVSDSTASHTRAAIWTAPVTTGGTAQTVALTFAGSIEWHSMLVEVWSGGQLAATPATVDTRGSGAPSTTLTTTAANSVVSWVDGDWAAVSPTGRTYNTTSATPTDEGVHDGSTTQYVAYYAYQTAASAATQTFGLTAPGGQTWTLLGIEIQASATAAASLPPQTVRRRGWLLPRKPRAAQPIPAQIIVTTTQAPPSQPQRRRLGFSPQRRRQPAQVVITVQVPPPMAPRRRGVLLPARRRGSIQPVPAPVVVVTTQALPPQPARQARTWLSRRRPRTAQPVPPQVVVQTVQALPPQPGRRPPRLPIVGRHRTAQPVPAQITVVTAQALPPQPGRRGPRLPVVQRHRTAQPVPVAVVVVTAQALPPQPARRPVRPLLTRRPRPTLPPLTVVVALPPQTVRRRTWTPTRRPRPAQPVPAQVIVVTAQALPPQPTRRLRWLPQRRRNQMGQPVPPQSVVVISIPVTVTGSDRPTTTVTGSDRPSASVSGSDRPTVTITSQ